MFFLFLDACLGLDYFMESQTKIKSQGKIFKMFSGNRIQNNFISEDSI